MAIVAWEPIVDIAAKVNGNQLKATDLINKTLQAIEDQQEYQAIIAPLAGRAKQRAAEIDSKISKGENAGRLAGVPFVAKDNFLTFGGKTTAASNILKTFEAPYQS